MVSKWIDYYCIFIYSIIKEAFKVLYKGAENLFFIICLLCHSRGNWRTRLGGNLSVKYLENDSKISDMGQRFFVTIMYLFNTRHFSSDQGNICTRRLILPLILWLLSKRKKWQEMMIHYVWSTQSKWPTCEEAWFWSFQLDSIGLKLDRQDSEFCLLITIQLNPAEQTKSAPPCRKAIYHA